jgi:hypothetical protein
MKTSIVSKKEIFSPAAELNLAEIPDGVDPRGERTVRGARWTNTHWYSTPALRA